MLTNAVQCPYVRTNATALKLIGKFGKREAIWFCIRMIEIMRYFDCVDRVLFWEEVRDSAISFEPLENY
jgi:hypothetical protein